MTIKFSLEMGLTHAEFFRTLPAAMADLPYRVMENKVSAEQGEQRLSIVLEPQQVRRIALMRLPYTLVNFEFAGYNQQEVDAFMDYFNSRYQRGGG